MYYYNKLVSPQWAGLAYPFRACRPLSTGWQFTCGFCCSKFHQFHACYRCMCSLIPALHARLFETPIRAVLRPYKSSGQGRPWLTKLLVSLSSYKRFVYAMNHAQRESWSFLVFLATHPSALLHTRLQVLPATPAKLKSPIVACL